jgi:dUTP pyrophosphatase
LQLFSYTYIIIIYNHHFIMDTQQLERRKAELYEQITGQPYVNALSQDEKNPQGKLLSQSPLKVRFHKLHSDATLPSYAHPGDAGLDLVAVWMDADYEKPYVEYGTELAVEIPPGYVGLLFPRSSISKTPLSLANSVGIIDSGYRGEIRFRFRTDTTIVTSMVENRMEFNAYGVGDRVGQLLILPYPQIEVEEAETLSEAVRAEGGFGSSGR